MSPWWIVLAWLVLAAGVLVVVAAAGRAGHEDDLAHGYAEPDPSPRPVPLDGQATAPVRVRPAA